MSQSAQAMLGARRDQMFPTMARAEIDRLHRFGESKFYEAGERIVKAGHVAPSLIVILSGKVEVTQGCGPEQALVIRSDRLRDLLVQEAELGESIMRALILRRVGLLESDASGPIVIGRANHVDALRLQGFLARNGQPHRVLDSDSDSFRRTSTFEPSSRKPVIQFRGIVLDERLVARVHARPTSRKVPGESCANGPSVIFKGGSL